VYSRYSSLEVFIRQLQRSSCLHLAIQRRTSSTASPSPSPSRLFSAPPSASASAPPVPALRRSAPRRRCSNHRLGSHSPRLSQRRHRPSCCPPGPRRPRTYTARLASPRRCAESFVAAELDAAVAAAESASVVAPSWY